MESTMERLEALERGLCELKAAKQAADTRARWWRGAACALGAVIMLVLPLQSGQAAGSGASPSLVRRVRLLETQLSALQSSVSNEIAARMSGDVSTLASANNHTDALESHVDASYATKTALSLEADLRVTGDTLDDGTPVRSLLPHFRRDGNNLYITGANLHIRSGGGRTDAVVQDPLVEAQGLGNLIVGYDEGFRGEKKGSHNVVIGFGHSYRSYAGLVAGHSNLILGPNASVAGGYLNSANGDFSHVSGGFSNTASGDRSSVSGGVNNNSNGNFSWIGGGELNTAYGLTSALLGGFQQITTAHRERNP